MEGKDGGRVPTGPEAKNNQEAQMTINLMDAKKKVSDFVIDNPELGRDEILVNLTTGQCYAEENAPDEAFDIVENKAADGWSWAHLLSRKLDN